MPPGTPMSPQIELVHRIRELLADEAVVREVSMFGGRAVMVNDKMIVSAMKDGGLLVRVAANRHAELLDRPGAAQAVMGAGRDMGAGWITVAGSSLDDDALADWITIALAYNRTITGGR